MRNKQVLRSLTLIVAVLAAAQFSVPTLAQETTASQHVGLPQDWSQQHIIYTVDASPEKLAGVQSDPRAFQSALMRKKRLEARRVQELRTKSESETRRAKNRREPHRDWSIPLGTFTPSTRTFPAKFTFDINAAPSCPNDYVVFPFNLAGSASQANIVAFNYLYSGSAPTNGICNNLVGNGTSAHVMWAYNVGTSPLATSPIPSLSGAKVAFVQNTSPSKFSVLAFQAGQGTSVTAPASPSITAGVPAAGSGQIISLTLTGGTNNTASSPFIDYTNDVAYVGTDNGTLFRINNVFCSTAACIANPVPPTLAGAPWPVAAGTSILTSPVFDQVSGNVFVGSADGKLYGFTSAGAPLAVPSLQVGTAAQHAVTDSPLVDSFGGKVYAFSGNHGGNGTAVQTDAQLGSLRRADVGLGGQSTMHLGSLNDPYFNLPTNQIGTTKEWFLYTCGVENVGGPTKRAILFRIGFDTARVMNTTVDSAQLALSTGNAECSPLTGFQNGIDRLFVGLRGENAVKSVDISSTTTPTQLSSVTEQGGTSAIVIDNVSSQAQASSIYFMTLAHDPSCGSGTEVCAVKLTQNGLN